jgi:transcription elongation factor GreA
VEEQRSDPENDDNLDARPDDSRDDFAQEQIARCGRAHDDALDLPRAQIIDLSKLSGKTVTFGATVTLGGQDNPSQVKYQIVGDLEADLKHGKVSISSPMARALIGRVAGDVIEVTAPGGARSYEILTVSFV